MLPTRRDKMYTTKDRILEEAKKVLNSSRLLPDLRGRFFSFLTKRVSTIGVRSFFVYELGNYITELLIQEGQSLTNHPKIFFNKQLPMLAEVMITVQYLENHILDEKGGVSFNTNSARKVVSEKLLSSHYIKDLFYCYIGQHVLTRDLYWQKKVRQTIEKIYMYVDVGQALQERYGTYNNLCTSHRLNVPMLGETDIFIDKKVIKPFAKIIQGYLKNKHSQLFIKDYLRRIYITNATIFVFLAELLMDIMKYQGKERQNILKAAASIGIISQLVNDLCDYVSMPTVSKKSEDAFSDLRNDIITLPLIIFFDLNPDKNLDYLQKIDNKYDLMNKLQEGIWPCFAILKDLRDFCKPFLNEKSKSGPLLEDLNSIILPDKNRSLNHLHEKMRTPAFAFC